METLTIRGIEEEHNNRKIERDLTEEKKWESNEDIGHSKTQNNYT